MPMYNEKELKAKAKKYVEQVIRVRDGKTLKHDDLPGDPEAAKESLKPYFFQNEYQILVGYFDAFWQALNPPPGTSAPNSEAVEFPEAAVKKKEKRKTKPLTNKKEATSSN